MESRLVFTLLLLTVSQLLLGQTPGTIDSTFDADGKVVTSFGAVDDRIFAIEVQTDGKIIVGGSNHNGTNYDFALARYHPNGTLDSSFGINGKVTTAIDTGRDQLWDIALQADGKIVSCGITEINSSYDFALVRYESDGSLDSLFGTNGKQVTAISVYNDYGYSVKIATDGKIYVGGSNSINGDILIVRYNTYGQLDTTFGTNGIVTTDAGSQEYIRDIALQNDGKILLVGAEVLPYYDFLLVRYDSTGNLDNTFGVNGIAISSIGTNLNDLETINSVIVQADNKIIAGGSVDFSGTGSNWEYAIARYMPDGNLDSSFGINGKVVTAWSSRDIIHKIFLQPDGRIVAIGERLNGFSDFALLRYNSNGSIDSSFGINGKLSTNLGGDDYAFAAALQPDLKIVAAGETYQNGKWNFALARYTSGLNVGVVDFEKVDNGMLIYPNPIKEHATLKYTLTKDENISINLYDLNGRQINSFIKNEKRMTGEHEEQLTFENGIRAGNYVLQITNGKTQQGIKIIIE